MTFCHLPSFFLATFLSEIYLERFFTGCSGLFASTPSLSLNNFTPKLIQTFAFEDAKCIQAPFPSSTRNLINALHAAYRQ